MQKSIVFTGMLMVCLFVQKLSAQKYESAQYLDTWTKQEITAFAGTPVAYDVDLYKLRYFTPDVHGEEHIASGLVCIPRAENIRFPLACYQHGTVNGRDDVPSNLAGGFQLPLVLAGFGYVSCAADFVGLGDSPGIHPYVHADTEASAGVDMLFAVREMTEDEDIPPFYISNQLFIGGYSQGGHASMAAHRLLETEYPGEFEIAAAAHMSGPYSVSEVMVDFTLSDRPYGTVSYLAWITLAYMEAYPELLDTFSLQGIFKEEYIDDIEAFRDEEIGLSQLNARITATLLNTVGEVLPREMLRENVLNGILSDPTFPMNQALADNDVYDWTPQAKTNLYYCIGDEQVSFENAILASSTMNANGAPAVLALRMDNTFPLTHTQCVSPAVTSVVFFFGAQQELTTSVGRELAAEDIQMYYGAEQIIFDVPARFAGKQLYFQVHSMDGRGMMVQGLASGMSQHPLELKASGMYVVSVLLDGHVIRTQKIVKP